MAALLSAKGDSADAISHLVEAVQISPDWLPPLNNLAWMLSTQPQAKLRNGTEATRLALRAVGLTKERIPAHWTPWLRLMPKRAAFRMRFKRQKAPFKKAGAFGQTNLAVEIQSRLKLYQSQQAYRE